MKGIDKPTGQPVSAGSTPGSGAGPGSPVPAGILVLDKPRGPSSMQAVARVRGRIKAGITAKMGEGVGPRRPKVGHAGTLDPLADGVLLIGVGAATRELGRLMGLEKGYRTVIDLSAFTSTDDEEGEREAVAVAEIPGEAAVRAAVAGFGGEGLQRPPAYSAVKVDGRRAYAMARGGDAPDIPARPIIVHEISVRSYAWPMVTVDIRCGKGFYVRSFARDLGLALGTGGTCRSIQRTAIGPFTIDEAIGLDALPATLGAEDLIPVDEAIRRAGAGAATGTATSSSGDAPGPDVG
jgi:tRNA pseudouridine55 synthase